MPFTVMFTVKEVATMARLKPVTIWKLCREKKIRTVQIGGSIRVPEAEVKRLFGMESANS